MLELAFSPDRSGREPLYRQLERFLRELVRTRRLRPGERLPASRELAASLSLSRNTVNQAYQALLDDGLLRAHVGQGTYVAGRAAVAAEAPPETPPPPFAWEGLVARRTRALPLPRAAPPPKRIRFDFRGGRVDPRALPTGELRRAFGRALRRLPELSDDLDPRGWPPLRRAIARSLVARGIACGPEEVAVVNGAQHGLALVARTLVDPGDTVALEQPGYFGAFMAFGACEAHMVGVGVDDDGLRTDELARLLRARRVKLVFTTPAVQHPTGVSLSESRRRALLSLADAYQLPIVEDDYDCELRHGGPPVPALKNLDDAGRVVYVGTFSKALFAGLRVGYVVAPPPLVVRLAIARFSGDFASELTTQVALTDLIESGGLERHVRRVRKLQAPRREALLAALDARMPEGTRATRPAGGSSVWVRMPDATDLEAMHRELDEAGIAVSRGDGTALPGGPFAAEAARHLGLSFVQIPVERMDDAVAALAKIVKRNMRSGRRAPGGRGRSGRRARRRVA